MNVRRVVIVIVAVVAKYDIVATAIPATNSIRVHYIGIARITIIVVVVAITVVGNTDPVFITIPKIMGRDCGKRGRTRLVYLVFATRQSAAATHTIHTIRTIHTIHTTHSLKLVAYGRDKISHNPNLFLV